MTTWVPQAVLTPVYTTTVGAYHPVSGTWLSLTLGAGDAISLQIRGTVSEAFTGTLMSTAVVTPVGARERNAADNIAIDVNPVPLLNPGFEGGHWHKTFEGENGAMAVPESWVAWWVTGDSVGGRMDVPDIVRVIDDSNPNYLSPVLRIRSGRQAFQMARWGAYRAGLYQRVEGLPPGAAVAFSAYAHAWACDRDDTGALSCTDDPYAFRSRVGIDPTGEDARNLDAVIWSEDHWIYDEFAPIGPVTATVGADGAVTVYIESYGKWPYKHNDAYWDDTALIVRPW